jgi:glycosyltransferase A (GT-A) superfamily protein (DUF2064 family)
LAHGKRSAKLLTALIIRQTKRTAKRTGLTVFHITEKQQIGNNFGERFANAFENVFNKGFEHVISIGNDCLSLSSEDLIFASNAFKHNNAVIGPAKDGGAYLIGLHRNVFDKTTFENINWQNSNTFISLLSYIGSNNGRLFALSEKSDIDHIYNLKEAILKAPLDFRIKISPLLKSRIILFISLTSFPLNHQFLKSSNSRRAPPLFGI